MHRRIESSLSGEGTTEPSTLASACYRRRVPAKRILIVGAGAVGQIYAKHLQRSGVHVAVLVKPKYAGAARAGFDLHRLSLVRPPRKERLDDLEVFDDLDEACEKNWDQIWLCISSAAARGE